MSQNPKIPKFPCIDRMGRIIDFSLEFRNGWYDFSLELGYWDIFILLFETFKKNKKGKKEKRKNKK